MLEEGKGLWGATAPVPELAEHKAVIFRDSEHVLGREENTSRSPELLRARTEDTSCEVHGRGRCAARLRVTVPWRREVSLGYDFGGSVSPEFGAKKRRIMAL